MVVELVVEVVVVVVETLSRDRGRRKIEYETGQPPWLGVFQLVS